jgi:hypothetical protein
MVVTEDDISWYKLKLQFNFATPFGKLKFCIMPGKRNKFG